VLVLNAGDGFLHATPPRRYAARKKLLLERRKNVAPLRRGVNEMH
jgi:hypothetical protein